MSEERIKVLADVHEKVLEAEEDYREKAVANRNQYYASNIAAARRRLAEARAELDEVRGGDA